jgi:hypothetical protein
MAQFPIGYAHLIANYELPVRELASVCYIDTAAAQRRESIRAGQTVYIFEPGYLKGEGTLAEHLEFALRYEGPNLEVLALLFARHGKTEIEAWLKSTPRGRYGRQAGFLYEFLTGNTLDVAAVPPKTGYIPLLDPKRFVTGSEIRNARFAVIVNLLGDVNFCPTVRKTDYIIEQQAKNLRAYTATTLARYDKTLLDRAAAFLYLKETHSSFSIEREKPSANRAERFAQLLAAAGDVADVTKEELVRLQNAVIDGRFAETWFRNQQNWVGREVGSYYKRVDFVPPRPEEVEPLLDGLLAFANRYVHQDADASDDVAIAASVAFGFVFIHPFMDGNGRLHRFLIHQMLSRRGFTPRGIILPVSAVMLANLDEYIAALENFSKPLAPLVHFDPNVPEAPATGNDALYYRYFDATRQAEFLYSALERTVTHDLEEEIQFLIHYDVAYSRLNAEFDWPKGRLDLFIRILAEHNGRLSVRKRESHFDFLSEKEVSDFEAIFAEAFELAPHKEA